jgi:outer membrane protein assembly factor BamB
MKRSTVLVLSLLLALAAAPAAADWPHLRGPGNDGRTTTTGVFDSESVGLEVAWTRPIGSGYSGIVVAGGRVFTAFAEGDGDWVAAFDAATGEPAWRHRLGETNRGVDGADDGPLSSPTVGKDAVYALAPGGTLYALRAKDGKELWSKDLVEDLGGARPYFGFTTTPLLVGETLIVQAGGEDGKFLIGLDAKKGKVKWSTGEDTTNYQSPAAMTLAGRLQVVAVGGKEIVGIAPESGDVLWTHPLAEGERANNASPALLGEDRFLVPVSGKGVVYRVSKKDGGFAAEEVYRTDTLGGNYAPPVFHDGYLYGFKGQILTCVDAATGERVWRSRPPGGDGLILVDDQLVIFGSKGNVVVAKATPEGYEERARVQALEGSSLTWPSFAGGRVYVRNLETLAAVAVTKGEPVAEVAEAADHAFGRWVASLETVDDRKAAIDAYVGAQESIPIVEGGYVHFLYRGEGQDVAIAGSMSDTGGPLPMNRVEGTDLFHRTFELPPGGRYEYAYQVDYETWKNDPFNDRTVPATEGEEPLSELVTPGYVLADHLGDPTGPRGTIESFPLESKILAGEKAIQVWLPPGYADGDVTYPMLIVHDAKAWLEKGLLANTLDNLVGKSFAPAIVVLIEAAGPWWTEAGGSNTENYIRMQVEELIPAIREKYRVTDAEGAHALLANRFYTIPAAAIAVRHPELFGAVALQSTFLGLGYEDELLADLTAGLGRDVRFYFDWNRYEERNIDRGWDAARDSRTLAAAIRVGGYKMTGGEVLDSAGWGGWRNRTGTVLGWLFPID